MPSGDLLHFIHTPLFDESADDALSADELRATQALLQEDPEAGSLVQGTGGARKLRVPIGGRGKSFGARVIYYFKSRSNTIYLLLAYDKTESDDLSTHGKRLLREILAKIDVE